MKPIMSLFLGLCLSANVFANDTGHDRSERELGKVLKCLRTVVEKREGGLEGITFASKTLEEVTLNKTDVGKLQAMKRECRKFKRENRRVPGPPFDVLRDHVNDVAASEIIRNIVMDFALPYYNCNVVGMDAHFAAGVGIGLGLGAAKCEGSNGRRFYAVLPKLGFNIGGGFGIYARRDNLTISSTVGVAEDAYLFTGMIVGGMYDLNAEFSTTATGAGPGVGMGIGGNLIVRMIPLRNNFVEIIEKL